MNTIILVLNLIRILLKPFKILYKFIRNLNDGIQVCKLVYTLLKYDILSLVSDSILWKLLKYLVPNSKRNLPDAERLQQALIELGPIWIKFGQILSLRADLLPSNFICELGKLQDDLHSFSGAQVEKILCDDLQIKNIKDVFVEFDYKPVAAASVAQVHRAKLKDNREVAVKILRPGVKKEIAKNLRLLKTLINVLLVFNKKFEHFKPQQLVLEISKSLSKETDLRIEAANCSKLYENFKDSSTVKIPKVIWPYSKANVFTMEFVYGTPIDDVASLREASLNLSEVAETGVEIFFKQIFEHNFFHADVHPGNLWIDISCAPSFKYIALDFGIVGSLSDSDKRYIAENLLAFFNQDYSKIAKLHIMSGWVDGSIDVSDFEAQVRAIGEPIFANPKQNISFGELLLDLIKVASKFQMNIQPQLLLLQKTLVNVETLVRNLYPEMDLWTSAKPLLEKWLQQQMGIKSNVKKLKDSLPYILDKMPLLLDKISLCENSNKIVVSKQSPKNNMLNVWIGSLLMVNTAFIVIIFYKTIM